MTEETTAGVTAVAETTDTFKDGMTFADYQALKSKVTEEPKAEPEKVEPEAKAETDDEGKEEDTEKDTGEGKKKRGGWQRKIDKLEAEIAALKAPIGTNPAETDAKPNAAADKEPQPEDFPTWGEYTKALVKHEAKQEAKAAKEESAKEQAKAEAQKTSMTKVEKYKSQVTEAQKTYKDFDAKLNEYEGPTSPELHAAILDSDNGAEVAYYLADNPDEAEKMRGMNTGDLYRFIGKIEAKLEIGKVKETPAVKTSNAPPPVKPVTKGTTSESLEFKEGMSFAEYQAKRAKGMK